ncbi:3'(2'),5'-bisphosphate nucleotidase CysQ family protein [Methylomonas rhizoryzae]|uniref:3'(2'),5'-bisphosphate nucleotidase CysQ family protein n=1 Tax=Methylomonas rhizoryzae TaxID=2608981 RepID=UPI001232C553|nr:inositol monophosphatase [Methylomonas rhizoryzae]
MRILDLSLLQQCAIAAAYRAGHYIARHAASDVAVRTKTGHHSLASQVVTEIDHNSQALIRQTLQAASERFDLAWLGEESPDDGERLRKDYFWCVDPLDGTLPFIEGIPGYSVSIALVSKDGTPCLGVVYDPLSQTLYHAVKGGGAFSNEQPLCVPGSESTTLTFITDKSFANEALYQATVNRLQGMAVQLGYTGSRLVLQGGAALNACQVLAAPACYFKFPKLQTGGGSVWDYAATACLFGEAGAPVADICGRSLDLNPPESTFLNHCGVLYSSDRHIADAMVSLYRELSGRLLV